jgi:zinc-ribbon domain
LNRRYGSRIVTKGGKEDAVSAFCEQCGAALGEGAKFCPACGKQVTTSTSEQPPARPAPFPNPAEAVPPQHVTPPKKKKPRWGRRILVGFGALVLLIIIISVIAGQSSTNNVGATGPSTTTPPSEPAIPEAEKNARAWIQQLYSDSNKVTANVQVVQIQVGLTAKNATVANIDKLAQYAQQAHDNLDAIRNDFALTNQDSGTLGNAELSAFSGANDLKNSMGALVAYTGNPNAATLASFTTQYNKARGEWNYGVRTIWRIAHRKHPPTV